MPKKQRHFKVLQWDHFPRGGRVLACYDLQCECGRDAICPVLDLSVNIEGRVGMAFMVDPQTPAPPHFLPTKIKCPKCGRIYSNQHGQLAQEPVSEPPPCDTPPTSTEKYSPPPTLAPCTENPISF